MKKQKEKAATAVNTINIEDYNLLYQKHGVQPLYYGGATGIRKFGLSACPDFTWKCGNKGNNKVVRYKMERLVRL